ncbi:hypothetical protein P885DRAFT_72038 [Corynascus similis CBS 632.67]
MRRGSAILGCPQLVYDTITRHFRAKNKSCRPPPLRLQIDGEGGTGKSYMVKVMPFHFIAPTGIASNQIGGQTLHSLLRLPINAILNALQRRSRGIHYLAIDEKSMLCLNTLARDEFFGGLSPLYSTHDGLADIKIIRRNAYLSFDKYGEDEAPFRRALEDLRKTDISGRWLNYQHVLSLVNPAILIKTKHNASNLAKRLPLFHDIFWKEGARIVRDLPEVVMLAFGDYTGITFMMLWGQGLLKEERLVVPILRIRQDLMGITFDKVVCDILAREFASGRSYMVVSWMKTLGEPVFEKPFDRSRIYRVPPSRAIGLKLLDYTIK